jgi:hypothetical protein
MWPRIAKPPHLAHLMMSADEEASSAPDLLITTSSITNIFTGTVQGVVDLAVRQLLALHRAGCELSMVGAIPVCRLPSWYSTCF